MEGSVTEGGSAGEMIVIFIIIVIGIAIFIVIVIGIFIVIAVVIFIFIVIAIPSIASRPTYSLPCCSATPISDGVFIIVIVIFHCYYYYCCFYHCHDN